MREHVRCKTTPTPAFAHTTHTHNFAQRSLHSPHTQHCSSSFFHSLTLSSSPYPTPARRHIRLVGSAVLLLLLPSLVVPDFCMPLSTLRKRQEKKDSCYHHESGHGHGQPHSPLFDVHHESRQKVHTDILNVTCLCHKTKNKRKKNII